MVFIDAAWVNFRMADQPGVIALPAPVPLQKGKRSTSDMLLPEPSFFD
jgi:hypothetical protein